MVTFDPHPLTVVAPEHAPRLLTGIEHRLELLAEAGLDLAAVLPFDEAMRRLTSAAFAAAVLHEALQARLVVVGEDFRFGHQRTGNVASLAELGDAHGFAAEVVPLVGGQAPMSSTRIRAMVAAGDLAGAAAALGRPHEVRGLVVPGDGRGRTLGFPTANVAVPAELALPPSGVYAVRAGPPGQPPGAGGGQPGHPPHLRGGGQALEVHLLDPSGGPLRRRAAGGLRGPPARRGALRRPRRPRGPDRRRCGRGRGALAGGLSGRPDVRHDPLETGFRPGAPWGSRRPGSAVIPTLALALALLADPVPADGVRLAPDPAPAAAPAAATPPAPGLPGRLPLPAAAGGAAAGLAALAAARSAGPAVGGGRTREPLVVFVSGHGNGSPAGLFSHLVALMGLDPDQARYYDYRWADGGRDHQQASEYASIDETADALDGYLAGLADQGRPIYLVGFSKGGTGIAELVARWDRQESGGGPRGDRGGPARPADGLGDPRLAAERRHAFGPHPRRRRVQPHPVRCRTAAPTPAATWERPRGWRWW